jgi:hypothetical protein
MTVCINVRLYLCTYMYARQSICISICPSACLSHRDKPRVCTPAKMFPHLKLIYFIIFCLWAPLLVLTQSKETVS